MSFKYHGNYCGPGYTGGKFTDVGDYTKAPTDSLDASCRAHDFAYEFGNSHQADHDLISQTSLGLNPEGLLNLGFRAKDIFYNNLFGEMPKSNKNILKSLTPALSKKRTISNALDVAFRDGLRIGGASSSSITQPPKKKVKMQLQPAQPRQFGRVGSTALYPSGNRSSMKSKRVYVEEDEYLGEISGSVSFSTTAYSINPGQSATFPWLSKQAAQYEKWGMDYLVFYFSSEVSEYASQGQTGKIMLSVNYDAADSAPTTKQEVEDTVPHVDAMPFQGIELACDPKMLLDGQHGKYVRPGILPGQSDIRLYDGGNLYVSTVGQAGSGNIGELHVRYRAWFDVPILASTLLVAPANNSVTLVTTPGSVTALTSNTNQSLNQNEPAVFLANGLGATFSGINLLLPIGNYLVDAYVLFNGTGSANTVFALRLLKTGVVQAPTASTTSSPTLDMVTASILDASLTQPWFVTMGVNDYLTFNWLAVFSAGGVSAYASLRIVSI